MREHNLNRDDFVLDEIESIELVGELDTIDIEVENTHMFFCNDIYTHNSALDKEYISIGDLAESFNKAMVADVLIGQTRSPEQKMNNEATFFLAKSRVGKDGYFYDAIFNTSLTKIELKELSIKEANEIMGKSNRPKLTKSQKDDLKM